MPLVSTDPAKAQEALKFFNWAFKNGAKMAEDLDYVPLPASVISKIQAETAKIK